MTGGEIVFGLGMYALMADITTADNRTKRMSVLDALKFVGIAIGFVSGGIIKAVFGWTPSWYSLCYVLRKGKQRYQREKENKGNLKSQIFCNQG